MSDFKEYVTLKDFSLNLDNGKDSVYLKRGDRFDFDGFNVKLGDRSGTSYSLRKVVGSWIAPAKKRATGASQTTQVSEAPAPKAPKMESGPKSLESSDELPDAPVVTAGQDKALEGLVDEYESQTYNQKATKVINDDETVAAKIEKSPDEAEVCGAQGVELATSDDRKRPVVSHEERVVKETSPQKKAPTQKKLEVQQEAPVAKATTSKKKTASAKTEQPTVSVEEDVVLETDYNDTGSTDVTSSTQAQFQDKKVSKTGKRVEGPTVIEEQDGQVVGKVKNTNVKRTVDGITVSTVVKATGESDEGDVVFESNSDLTSDVEISGQGDAIVDLSGTNPESEEGVSVVEGSGIDLDDLLDDV